MKVCQVRELVEKLDPKTQGVLLQTAMLLEDNFGFTRGSIAVDWLLELLQKRFKDKLGNQNPHLLAMSLYREICAKIGSAPKFAADVNKVIRQLTTGGEMIWTKRSSL
jgi:hypothetical protein